MRHRQRIVNATEHLTCSVSVKAKHRFFVVSASFWQVMLNASKGLDPQASTKNLSDSSAWSRGTYAQESQGVLLGPFIAGSLILTPRFDSAWNMSVPRCRGSGFRLFSALR
jgi:hypothetical protein